jgi:HAE1 family hydrophobic/amphiphilic exporter-1
MTPTGKTKEMAKTQKTFLAAFALAFIFMYLILAAQFESWLHPITILALAAAHPAVRGDLDHPARAALNIFSMLGVLVLFGVIKKNSILQNRPPSCTCRRRHARAPRPSSWATDDRLKPILMTTLAFVAGMVPLLFSHGIGAGFNRATPAASSAGRSCRCS